MHQKSKLRRRVTSLVTLALILVPMLGLMAFASSAHNFAFSLGAAVATDYSRGYKSDVNDSGTSRFHAQVNIESGSFNGGSINLCVKTTGGTQITGSTAAGQTGTYYLYYDPMPSSNCYLNLTATVRSGVPNGCSGKWWP